MLTFEDKTHTYRWNGEVVKSVSKILKQSGEVNYDYISDDEREYVLTRGKYVHLATELLDRDELDEDALKGTIKPYLEAYKLFKKRTGFKPLLIEYRGYHQKLKYAGTLDRVGLMNGKLVLIDFKSGVVAKWVRLQTAAYEAFLPPDFAVTARHGLQLKKDGTYKLSRAWTDPSDFTVFQASIIISNWRNKK